MKRTKLATKFAASFMVMCMIICSALPVFAFESHGRIVYNDSTSGQDIVINGDEIVEALKGLTAAAGNSNEYKSSESSTYVAGDYVYYNGKLYKVLKNNPSGTPGSSTDYEYIPTAAEQYETLKSITPTVTGAKSVLQFRGIYTADPTTPNDGGGAFVNGDTILVTDGTSYSTRTYTGTEWIDALSIQPALRAANANADVLDKIYNAICNPISSSSGVTIGDTKCQLGSEIAVAIKRSDEEDYDSTKKFKICWIQVDEDGKPTRLGLLGSGSSGDNWGAAVTSAQARSFTWDWRIQIDGTTYSNTSTTYSGNCADLLNPSRTDLTANYKATIPSIEFLYSYCAGYGRPYDYWTNTQTNSLPYDYRTSGANSDIYAMVTGTNHTASTYSDSAFYGNVGGVVTGADVYYYYSADGYLVRSWASARAVPCIVVNL